jgi:hypothetical protein
MAILASSPTGVSACHCERRLKRARAVVMFAALALLLPCRFAAQETQEYQVKGVLLYHLTQFVEWPASAFATPEEPFTIGILGNDPFEKALEEIIRGEKAGTRPIVVARYQKVDAAKKCHLLFIGASEKDNLRKIMAQLKDRPILTVADTEGFIRSGGMIHLYKNQENKIRLRINLNVVKGCGLTVSSKLLRVAEIVHGEDD